MLKVGITGGIGSGKSVVSKIIETMGYPVFNSDEIAKTIVNNNANVRKELEELFGPEVYSDNVLNKQFLAKIIFSDDTAREKVNSVIHPRVHTAFDDFTKGSVSNIVFNEAAILFETGGYKQMDKMVLVTAPKSLKVERVCKRDGVEEKDVHARMNKQWLDDQKAPLSDYIITNDEIHPLVTQVEQLIEKLSSAAMSN